MNEFCLIILLCGIRLSTIYRNIILSNRAFTLHFSSCVHCDVELEENYDSKQKQYKRNKNKSDKTMLSACSSQQKLSGKLNVMMTIIDTSSFIETLRKLLKFILFVY